MTSVQVRPTPDQVGISEILGGMAIGDTQYVNNVVVARWGVDEYEVVSYGRHWFGRETAAVLIGD